MLVSAAQMEHRLRLARAGVVRSERERVAHEALRVVESTEVVVRPRQLRPWGTCGRVEHRCAPVLSHGKVGLAPVQ